MINIKNLKRQKYKIFCQGIGNLQKIKFECLAYSSLPANATNIRHIP